MVDKVSGNKRHDLITIGGKRDCQNMDTDIPGEADLQAMYLQPKSMANND